MGRNTSEYTFCLSLSQVLTENGGKRGGGRTCAVTRRCLKKHLFIHVYCVCHRPESYDSNMIACDKSGTRFNFK